MAGVSFSGVVGVVKEHPVPIVAGIAVLGGILWYATSGGGGGGATVVGTGGPSEALQVKMAEIGLQGASIAAAAGDKAGDRQAQIEALRIQGETALSVARLQAASTDSYNAAVIGLEGRKIDAASAVAASNASLAGATLQANKELGLANLATQERIAAKANALSLAGLEAQLTSNLASYAASLRGKEIESATVLEQTRIISSNELAGIREQAAAAITMTGLQTSSAERIAGIQSSTQLGMGQLAAWTGVMSAKQANKSNFFGIRF